MRGYTLIELAAVLTLFAVGAATLARPARRLSDRAAVVAARERIVALFLEARSYAVSSGGSSVFLRTGPAEARVVVDGRVRRRIDLESDLRVELDLGLGRDSVEVRFDGFGLGRFANLTLTLAKGDADAGLVVSSYGRIRRR